MPYFAANRMDQIGLGDDMDVAVGEPLPLRQLLGRVRRFPKLARKCGLEIVWYPR